MEKSKRYNSYLEYLQNNSDKIKDSIKKDNEYRSKLPDIPEDKRIIWPEDDDKAASIYIEDDAFSRNPDGIDGEGGDY